MSARNSRKSKLIKLIQYEMIWMSFEWGGGDLATDLKFVHTSKTVTLQILKGIRDK